MENKQSPSKKKLISIQEDKLMSEGAYESNSGNSTRLQEKLLLDLEILNNPKQPSQKVLVSVKQRVPAIKTIYISEKNRFRSKRGSDKSQSQSRLGIGDHSSFNTYFSEDDSSISSAACIREKKKISNVESSPEYSSTVVTRDIPTDSKCSKTDDTKSTNIYNDQRRSPEKCYIYTHPQLIMHHPTTENKNKLKTAPETADIGVFVELPTSEESDGIPYGVVKSLYQRIEVLERKIQRQEMVFRALEPSLNPSSSDEECNEPTMRSAACGAGGGGGAGGGAGPARARPGCSYIQQYSHVPERSAFHRYAHQASPLSPSKAATIDKEHNSEQYGRDFTTYDGLTARGRRQCASMPGKRDEAPKMAAERVNKIRHKLNPVRDYRLMDTVHYLAQGEFAPRDDGIKLTPSREAVLSDIIWEDVCRTHWPNARLGRRGERCNTRSELQRLIDSLLRERVAHVERRRRRHYRIVKLNHRHENCRPVGKTGDIIVANKNKETNAEREVLIRDHNAASAIMASSRREGSTGWSNGSHDRLVYLERLNRRRLRQEEGVAGPSYAAERPPTCCYRAGGGGAGAGAGARRDMRGRVAAPTPRPHDLTSTSSTTSRAHPRPPRLLVKKDLPRRKSREEPSLDQLILLPTLVIRTPSNVRRQKKFNELYHRILNSQLRNAQNCAVGAEAAERRPQPNTVKRDVGLNINITLSGSEEQIQNSKKTK